MRSKRELTFTMTGPTIITDPKDISKTAGSLHCGTLLHVQTGERVCSPSYPVRRLGMVVKGCDMMGLLELAKRNVVNLDNIRHDRCQLWWIGQPGLRTEDDQGKVRR